MTIEGPRRRPMPQILVLAMMSSLCDLAGDWHQSVVWLDALVAYVRGSRFRPAAEGLRE